MNRPRTVLAVTGLALLTFFQFPGHTWLQQDTQIYLPILEHLRDPSVLRNDPIAAHPHVAFTLYDEIARGLRRTTGLSFREVLEAQQVAARALGIWGLVLLAESLGLSLASAFAVAAICSLGTSIAGPAVLTLEYEPSPRAFAVPLLFCAAGLASRRRWTAAGVAGAAAFLYHPPTTLPLWLVWAAGLLLMPRERRGMLRGLWPVAAAAVVLLAAARAQGGGSMAWFSRLTAIDVQAQWLRTRYVWVSLWPPAWFWHQAILLAIAAAAWMRVRTKASGEARLFLLGLPLVGLLSMPVSWILLEHLRWSLVPQIQPTRALLFLALAVQFLGAVAAIRASRRAEAFLWFAVAFLLPVQPLLTDPWKLRGLLVVAALAAAACVRPVLRLPAALAAFFAIPLAAGVVNYPKLHTPELAGLSAWARTATPADAVFLFPTAGHGVQPGIFRGDALRAVYVDWKGGGQVNYLSDFAAEWWYRWQQTAEPGFQPADLARYAGLGIQYVVLPPENRLSSAPLFANRAYLVYRAQ